MKKTPSAALTFAAALLFVSSAAHANWPNCYQQRKASKKVYSCLATGRIFSYRDRLPYAVNDFGACLIPNDPDAKGGQLGNYEWFGVSMKLEAQAGGQTLLSIESPHRGIPKARARINGLPAELDLTASSEEMYSDNNLFLSVQCFLLPPLPAASKDAPVEAEDLSGRHCLLPAESCPK